jgi:hypothetical protein
MGLNWDWGGFARGVAGSLAQEYSPQMRMLRPLRKAQTRLADAQSGLAQAQAGSAEAQLRGLQSLVEMLPGWIEYYRTGKLPDETSVSATSPDGSNWTARGAGNRTGSRTTFSAFATLAVDSARGRFPTTGERSDDSAVSHLECASTWSCVPRCSRSTRDSISCGRTGFSAITSDRFQYWCRSSKGEDG